ncbi:MAG: hypothetical protein D8M57_10110 [Candidatus Scalindua sp. AMX11]|nr:MAG: hypothetical protein D8M57_10110 [Candidatus Scalindua sp. AMX11]
MKKVFLEVAWFVKTIFYYFLDALLNDQYGTKCVTEGARRATGVTHFLNSQTTPPCLFLI